MEAMCLSTCAAQNLFVATLRSMRLSLEFYERPALAVARELLGQRLVYAQPGVKRRVARIVETEAYIGPEDLAAHSSKGKTARTRVLFGPAGRSYVYFVYGMHDCFNVVADQEGIGAAVLVRGVELLQGFDPSARGDGPARLTRAFGITGAQNDLSLIRGSPLWLEAAAPVPDAKVATGPRIGVDYAKEWAKKPFRFWVKDSPGVSRRAPVRPRSSGGRRSPGP